MYIVKIGSYYLNKVDEPTLDFDEKLYLTHFIQDAWQMPIELATAWAEETNGIIIPYDSV